jgi:N-acetylglutamate synthase-like GNAT family acetyltransferase
MHIIGPTIQRACECEAVLRSLPTWFGIEPALLMYARDSALMPTFALAEEAQGIAGFLTLHEHFADAWEIHCIAVHAGARGKGLGSRLLSHAESWLVERGVRFLQVKTVAATSPSVSYAQTREFYARRGFTPIEIFPTLWNERNPALQCIKVLQSGHRGPASR